MSAETKWTPGPWAINGDKVESEKDHGWANDGWCICLCHGPDNGANARLIAAAPELCGALEAARSQLNTLGTPDDPVNNHIIGLCDAALAKARGEIP